MKLRTLPYLALATVAAVAYPTAVCAVVALDSIAYSSDIAAQVGGVTFEDEAIVHQSIPFGIPTPRVPQGIPAGVDVDAFYQRANGTWVLSFDTTVTVPSSFFGIPGSITVGPGDVVTYTASPLDVQYVGIFTASLAGIPDGVNVDAVHESGALLYLSFDTTVAVGGLTIDDEDVVEYDAVAQTFKMILDNSELGIATSLDLDAFHLLQPEFLLDPFTYLVSFDGSGEVQGVSFDDEDVLQYTPNFFIDGGGLWEIAYDSSGATFGSFASADLDALFVVKAEGTPTPTLTPSNTMPPTSTPTHTQVPTVTPSFTRSPTFTLMPTSTNTPTLPPTPPSTATATTIPTATNTEAPTATGTVPPTVTSTPTNSPTGTLAATATATNTQIDSTPSRTSTATTTPTSTPTETATFDTTATATSPGDLTQTPTQTATMTFDGTRTPTATATESVMPTSCTGDCDGSGDVTVDEIITMVNIALGLRPVEDCIAGDSGDDGSITVDEIVAALNAALEGCVGNG